MMKYKGYVGHVEYDDEAKILHGEVVGLSDIITFQGKSVDELEEAFKGSVDNYLTWCKERGEKPEKTFSDTFNLRIPPGVKISEEVGSPLARLMQPLLPGRRFFSGSTEKNSNPATKSKAVCFSIFREFFREKFRKR